MMLGKMKDKVPSKGEPAMEKKKPMAGIEIEIESDGEAEDSLPSESEGEGLEELDEEVSVGQLAKFSDEELKAELEKRGMAVAEGGDEGGKEGKEVASGGSSLLALPEGEEEQEVEIPKKKKYAKA